MAAERREIQVIIYNVLEWDKSGGERISLEDFLKEHDIIII